MEAWTDVLLFRENGPHRVFPDSGCGYHPDAGGVQGGWDQILPRLPVAGHKMPEPADGISDRGKGGANRIL